MKTIEIDGKKHLWRDLLRLRREQKKAARQHQLSLFPLEEDSRPKSERTASGRYTEPSFFGFLSRK